VVGRSRNRTNFRIRTYARQRGPPPGQSWRQVSARWRWPAFMKAAFIKASGLTRRNRMNKSRPQNSESPSQLIDARIQQLGDWRGKMLSQLRALIKQADPEVVEEWKWRGVPVWSHN